MNIGQFVENLEKEVGVPLYRRIKVLPETAHRKKKEPKGERNKYTPDVIKNDRGYADKHQNTHMVFTDYSLYLKHMPGYWVVDVDTKDKAQLSSELPKRLFDAGCYHTETAKGYHFYIKCPDAPTNFSDELEVFKDFKGDFLGRDKGNNVWETKTRLVQGNHIMEFDWGDLGQYMKQDQMYKPSKEDRKKKKREKKKAVLKEKAMAEEDPDPEGLDPQRVDDVAIKSYLSRICPNAKHYDDWLKIGIILFNAYNGKNKGLNLWNEWCKKSPKYEEDEQETKWDTFRNDHPDKIGWKSLKFMADKENPLNMYEALYNEGGEDRLVREMNKELCFNKHTCEYIRTFLDVGKHEDGKWNTFKRAPIQTAYNKYKFWVENEETGKKRKVNPFDIWDESNLRRDVKKIAFDARPTGIRDPDIYNIWQGYAMTAEQSSVYDEEDAQPVLDHIFNIWCQCREDYYEYVLNWFAHLLQFPWIKIGTLLALQSEQGAGKGVVMKMIEQIMGTAHFTSTCSMSNIIGDFNGGLEGKVLIDLDEAFWGGDVKVQSKMKSLITETTQLINKKCKEAYEIQNTSAFMITTNNELFAGIEKGDRRYFPLRLDDKFAGVETDESRAYFASVRGCASNQDPPVEVYGALAKFLYRRDLSGFRPRKIPRTDLLQDQIERGWNSVVKWWKDMLVDGRFGLPDFDKEAQNRTSDMTKYEYEAEMEYWGYVKPGINGRIVGEKYKVIVGDEKYWVLKDYNGTEEPMNDETKSQYLARRFYGPVRHSGPFSNTTRESLMKNNEGGLAEVSVMWEGRPIPKYQDKQKVNYRGYDPKWLYQVYLTAHRSNRLGHGKPEVYNAWCQKMNKMFKITKRTHGSSKRDTTWEIIPLAHLRVEFNRFCQYEYKWDADVLEVEATAGGKLIDQTDGGKEVYNQGCMISDDE